jgi:hypothetical protein
LSIAGAADATPSPLNHSIFAPRFREIELANKKAAWQRGFIATVTCG